ncbi:MAG TPA: pyruvate:ferredoxin (flavodoxin) oxidoreductase [Polyangiaceae bacterium]|nr:pyruvate:ferredoxin (flavodoxin) oxidoreductase [Polyangiaceae bacterium]
MSSERTATIDGNEAAASVAYRLSEVCAIYPITPSSTMAELADQWSAERRPNVWGTIPDVIEMQSEGGAAGTLHGAVQAGALATTFTASQGLLLMIPNMYKIAGELSPAVLHVAARALATQGLSIFGDHSDVMAVRATGFVMLASSSVQEAHDMAAVAHAAALAARLPFLHFFDGFRTSHEVSKLSLLSDDDLRSMVDDDLVRAHRSRSLNPDHPFIRGTAQNPDVFFQSRETVNPFYTRAPEIVIAALARLAALTGRKYNLFDYHGDPSAERVVMLIGSGVETARETVEYLRRAGERVGVLQVRLFRPFSLEHLLAALPPSVKALAVMDRTKEPGAVGEPLYVDTVTALAEALAAGRIARMPLVIGGRYGLGSKELTPAMVKAVLDELARPAPRNHFTIGIHDDVAHTSLSYDPAFVTESERVVRAMFFGLGSDGTVGANKNSIKIIAEDPAVHAQGYFVYDSKKSGSQTVSHLRFGPEPIRSAYLVQSANFIGCHQFGLLEKLDVLGHAAHGATLLLDSEHGPDAIWSNLPLEVQQQILDKAIRVFTIDAKRVAQDVGMEGRTNTVMQTCFFAISGVLPRERAIAKIKAAIEKTYGRKGAEVVRRNFEAVDQTLARLNEVPLPAPGASLSGRRRLPVVSDRAPAFVREVTALMMSGRGDELPVSALPVDGTYPSATARWEKRNISDVVASWDAEICIQCGNCSLICPHAVIRSKLYHQDRLAGAPAGFKSAPIDARGMPEIRYTLQVYVEDCTGCGLCVEVCPVTAKDAAGHRAINLDAKQPSAAAEVENIAFFETLPEADRARVDFSTVRGAQYLEPLFEFSGACAGCGETPYLKLMSQLFGDRLLVANATGCSSIYGGNLPTTPWSQNAEGRGPAWSNSLFEDNAEFGLGFRLAADRHLAIASRLLRELSADIGAQLVDEILSAPQQLESQIRAQRERVARLRLRLAELPAQLAPRVAELLSVADHLVRRSVWLVGGDGWAYDIGAGGLDHVLGSGRDVNVLVLDTEVYSNTGGQASKSTPLGAVAKFAAAGKRVGKKDLALQAISYGNVYVAQVAAGANPQQTLLAFREAEAYAGPSLIIAYSPCIAHGIAMQRGPEQQIKAVQCGHWPLIRYNPVLRPHGKNPFMLDSLEPRLKFHDYANGELRYRMLSHSNPEEARRLMKLAQQNIERRWQTYAEMATRGV